MRPARKPRASHPPVKQAYLQARWLQVAARHGPAVTISSAFALQLAAVLRQQASEAAA